MSLIYVEFMSRRPGASLETFHKMSRRGQTGWATENQADRVIAMVGRTWRTGPEPEYLCIWWTPEYGLARLDEWEATFRSGAADAYEEPFALVARIDRAGSYDPLLEPEVGSTERYYLEYFDFAPRATRADVTRVFEERRTLHGDLRLNLVCDRISRLAPDPRGLALWGLPAWCHLESIAREIDNEHSPVQLVTSGLYSTLGHETL